MFKAGLVKGAARPLIVLGLLGLTTVGAVDVARGSLLGSPRTLRSTSPCSYSLELASSISARRQYLVELDQATGGGLAAGGAVDQMYADTELASYNASDDDGSFLTMLGFATKKEAPAPEVDVFSQRCFGCHDGGSAIAVALDLRSDPYSKRTRRTSHAESDHPIGMHYDSYLGRGYKPLMGDNKMVLVNGRVGCLTCHDMLNTQRGHLVMSDTKSALCLTCHNK